MRAWVQTGFGGPEVRTLEEIPTPVPAEDEVLIKVDACALNRLDILQREAPLVGSFQLPHIAGMDIVGRVIEAGSRHGARLVGSTVVLDPVVTCGTCNRCLTGLEAYCVNFRTIGSSRQGGFAEFVCAPASNCLVVGATEVPMEDLACVPVASVTAWHGLLRVGRIQSGETIVVPGGGSGLGVAGIQIAKAHGCRVVTMVSGVDKVKKAEAIGADIVIERSRRDWVAEVLDVTGGIGADLVWDHVGGGFLQQAIDAVRLNGRIVMSGTTAGNESCIRNSSLFHWGKSILGHGGYSRQEMRDALAAYCAGDLKVIVDSRWRFEELPRAERRLETNEFFGKVLVCM